MIRRRRTITQATTTIRKRSATVTEVDNAPLNKRHTILNEGHKSQFNFNRCICLSLL